MLSLLGDCNLQLKAYRKVSEHPLIRGWQEWKVMIRTPHLFSSSLTIKYSQCYVYSGHEKNALMNIEAQILSGMPLKSP